MFCINDYVLKGHERRIELIVKLVKDDLDLQWPIIKYIFSSPRSHHENMPV